MPTKDQIIEQQNNYIKILQKQLKEAEEAIKNKKTTKNGTKSK